MNSDTVIVVITVTNVNEPPDVDGDTEVTFQEVAGDIATPCWAPPMRRTTRRLRELTTLTRPPGR